MYGLTQEQANFLRTLRAHIGPDGRAPTRRELMRLTGIRSTSGIQRYLQVLEERGYIKTLRYKSRSIMIVGQMQDKINMLEDLLAGLYGEAARDAEGMMRDWLDKRERQRIEERIHAEA